MPILLPSASLQTPGDLTLSGNLYEGNFEEWHARIMASLRLRRLDVFLSPGLWFTEIGGRTTKEAADHICATISETMLKRIPTAHKNNCSQLMVTLKRFATPFRFLELPAVLKNKIYKLVTPDSFVVLEWDFGYDRLPPLLETNSLIRREASLIFYANTTFIVKADVGASGMERHDDTELEHFNRLQKWSKYRLGQNARHLRSLELWLTQDFRVIIKFRKTLTLRFKGDHRIKGNTENIGRVLGRHDSEFQRTREALNLEGETIILALLIDWNMWWRLLEHVYLQEDREYLFEDVSDDDSEDWNWMP